jgi:hypothetical protein
MFRIAFALLATIQSIAPPAPAAQERETKKALEQAEALYYAARFKESIAVLTPIDEAFKTQAGPLQDKVETKLKLALAHIGTNETATALSFLIEMYALNPDYVFDARQFSPKVVALVAEARTEWQKTRCQRALTDARRHLAAGDSKSFIALLRSSRSQCPSLSEIGPEAADSLYKEAVAAYKRAEFTDAIASFEMVLSLAPGHELSLQYMDVIKSRQQLDKDRLLMQWQRNFNERRFAAAEDYRQILSQPGGRLDAAAIQVTGEYRKALLSLVNTWNQSCAGGEAASINGLLAQMSDLLPEPSFGEDIRRQVRDCPRPLTVASVASDECLEMPAEVALARVKTKVDPVITSQVRQFLKSRPQTIVRVKVRIGPAGDVAVKGMSVGIPVVNKVVQNAVVGWEFTPMQDSSGPRCVDTELPFVIQSRSLD